MKSKGKNKLKFNTLIYTLLSLVIIAYVIIIHINIEDNLERLRIYFGIVMVMLWNYQYNKINTLKKKEVSHEIKR